tara:strand:+ start:2579 stop:2833 length:255 start_codon:yes stop_codon:yes gene_type:complete
MSSEALKYIKNQIAEHYDNFALVAIDADGNLIWDYNNWMVALMLLERARAGIEEDSESLEITVELDDDDDGGWEQEAPVPNPNK